MTKFVLNPRLEADSVALGRLSVCLVRLMNDRRWPWLVLIPERRDLAELHDLAPGDLANTAADIALASRALSRATGCHKINTGALGNVVRQLHIHVIARNEGDPNWPGPVWGFGQRENHLPGEIDKIAARLGAFLFSGGSAHALPL